MKTVAFTMKYEFLKAEKFRAKKSNQRLADLFLGIKQRILATIPERRIYFGFRSVVLQHFKHNEAHFLIELSN